MNIFENEPLKQANTLSLSVVARYFSPLTKPEQLPKLIAFAENNNIPFMVIGGGSNVVLPAKYSGLIIGNELKGVKIIKAFESECFESCADGQLANDTKKIDSEKKDSEPLDSEILLESAAGEDWCTLVEYCLSQGYYGLENLALIPGSVGAAPVQNIGAYGVELKNFVHTVRGWDCRTKSWKTLSAAQCEFSYRHSIFKSELKNVFIITSVTFKLTTTARVNAEYPALKQSLIEKGFYKPTPQQIAETVVAIRRSKLPDPEQLPNVGSFFKNPIVDYKRAEALKSKHPKLVCFVIEGTTDVKLSAGWLIEQAGWKGHRMGKVGMHDKQSLVLVNYGNASANDIIELVTQIKQSIQQMFKLTLEIEPDIISPKF